MLHVSCHRVECVFALPIVPMHHAADDKRSVAEGEKIIGDSLEGWPDASSPVGTSIISPEDLREEIKTLIDRRMWETVSYHALRRWEVQTG